MPALSLASLAKKTAHETLAEFAALSSYLPVNTVDQPMQVTAKCMPYLHAEVDNASDEVIKSDLAQQMKYLQKIQSEVSVR